MAIGITKQECAASEQSTNESISNNASSRSLLCATLTLHLEAEWEPMGTTQALGSTLPATELRGQTEEERNRAEQPDIKATTICPRMHRQAQATDHRSHFSCLSPWLKLRVGINFRL